MRSLKDLRSLWGRTGWQAPAWITRNLRVKLLAILLALSSWVVVVYAANPPDTRQILVHVSQNPQELPGKFVLAHPIGDVAILISGTRDQVDNFQVASIRATPDFSRIKRTGLQQLPLTVVNTDPNVDTSDVPSAVTADIDVNGETSLPVVVHTTPTEVGYEIVSASTAPASVELIGPQRELQIAEPVVNVDLGTRISSLSQGGVPVFVVDSRNANRTLSDVTVQQAQVQVTVVIKPVDGTLVSLVTPQVIGNVAPGHELSGVSADPTTVILLGPEPLLNGLQQIPTPQVSISGLSSDHIFTITLTAPNGLKFQTTTGTVVSQIQVNIHVSVSTLPDAVITPTPSSPGASPPTRPATSSTPAPGCRQAPLGTPCPSPTP